MKISIIIPLLNEEDSLLELNDKIINVLNTENLSYEIIFIDDGFNNVRSASVLGINSIRFIGLDNLVEEIQKLDIKIS